MNLTGPPSTTAMADDVATRERLRMTVRTLTESWIANGRYRPRSDSWVRSFDVSFSKAVAEHGLIGMTWPRRFGGGEYSNRDRLAVTEELLRAGAPVAAHWIADRQIGPAILRHGSEGLQQEILPAITTADALFCLGMSEPEAGSDLAAVRTTARQVDGGWVLRGRKQWTTGAHLATHAYVLARTSPSERKHEGLSEFVVDMGSPGVTVTPIVDMAGQHHFNEMLLEDVYVPEGRLLGTENNGWRQVIEQLSFERGGPERILSTYPLLIEALAQADSIRLQGAEAALGVLVARLATLRQVLWDLAGELDAGGAPVLKAATLKYLGNVFERDVVEFAHDHVQSRALESGYGQSVLAAPGFSIRGGAADVLLSIISRQEVADERPRS
jgi:acyl-CoA dehydrogenase